MTLTDKQKQDIEQEAEKYWPAAVAFGEKARRAYIAGATAQLLALNGRDEEIANLKKQIEELSKQYNELYDQAQKWKEESGN